MKKILLVGDSIRFGGAPNSPGYGVIVKEKLENIAEVYAPNENCRFAQYILRYLHEWSTAFPKEEIDIVHFNCGLWDVLRLLGDEPFSEINNYGETLQRICKRIKMLFPKAKIVFALTTCVKEEWGFADFFRKNCDVEAYNQKAIEVLEPMGVYFNDLYALTKNFEDGLRADWVHFNEEGCKVLADAVIKKCFEVIDEK